MARQSSTAGKRRSQLSRPRKKSRPNHSKEVARQAIKRGRPTEVTRSEKRKLARLYVCTTLSTPQIRRIFQRFTGKQISDRACQNHIQDVLHTDLKAARPKDAKSGHHRVDQLQRYRTTGFSESENFPHLESSLATETIPEDHIAAQDEPEVNEFLAIAAEVLPGVSSLTEGFTNNPSSKPQVGVTSLADATVSESFLRSATESSLKITKPLLVETHSANDLPSGLEKSGSGIEELSLPELDSTGWDVLDKLRCENFAQDIHRNDEDFHPGLFNFGFNFGSGQSNPGDELLIETPSRDLGLSLEDSDVADESILSTDLFNPGPPGISNSLNTVGESLDNANQTFALADAFGPSLLEHVDIFDHQGDCTVQAYDIAHGGLEEDQNIDQRVFTLGKPVTAFTQSSTSLNPPVDGTDPSDFHSEDDPDARTENQMQRLYFVDSLSTSNMLGNNSLIHLRHRSHERVLPTGNLDNVTISPGLDLTGGHLDRYSPPLPIDITEGLVGESAMTAISPNEVKTGHDLSSSSRGLKRALSVTSSIISGPLRDRRKLGHRRSSLNSLKEGHLPRDSMLAVGSFHFSTPSLRSFGSRRSDIITLFKRMSSGSRETKGSSTYAPELDSIAEHSTAQTVSIRKLHATKQPVETPDLKDVTKVPERLRNAARNKTWTHEEKIVEDLMKGGPDLFNNLPLHVVSAAGARYDIIKKVIHATWIKNFKGGHKFLNETNAFGQTFMHVLDPSALIASGHLCSFLRELDQMSFDFSKQDHHGVNMLQALLQRPLNHALIEGVFDTLKFHVSLSGSRDNLGRCVQSRLLYLAQAGGMSGTHGSQTVYDVLQRHFSVSPVHSVLYEPYEDKARSQIFTDYLEATILQSIQDPTFEDAGGRNGFHNLAFLASVQDPKLLVRDSTPRIQDIESYHSQLLQAGVSVSNYDKTGQTPLLAMLYLHVPHDSDQACDASLKRRMTDMIKAGASVHSRGRQGETPLHLAVSRGIITATRILITNGANVNAVQKGSKSVLRLAIETANRIRSHKALHLRIQVCINIILGDGAVITPTNGQEWNAIDQSWCSNSEMTPGASASTLTKPATVDVPSRQRHFEIFDVGKAGSNGIGVGRWARSVFVQRK